MSKALKKLIDINRLREFKNKLVGAGSAYVQTAAVDQTIAGTKTFSKPIVGSVTGSSGSCTGNAATATKATQDAAGNTITTTYATKAENNTKANDSDVVHKSGDETIVGTKTFNDNVHASGFYSTAPNALMAQRGEYTLVLRNDGDNTYLLMSDKGGVPGTWSSARPLVISNSRGVCDINGNAATATKATQDSDGNKITTTYSKNGHTHDDRYYTETEVNNLLNGKANTSHIHYFLQTPDNNHAISFDWSSQVPGFVGLTVDETKLGGIVTTTTLRAQWYAAYPDGAEAHNAMWGGRDITAAFNNGTVSRRIADGTFRDIFPGDYITKQVTISGTTYTVNWVIADCDYWINKGDQGDGMTAHHVAIVPQAPIFNTNMNATNTTEGGYAGSRMYKETIPACATGIVSAFGSEHILTFRDGITNSVDTSHVSSGITQFTGTPGWWGEWVSVQCNLMSEKMVYGAPICSGGAMDNSVATRQMSAFRLSQRLINYNRQVWWLRDVVSSANFAFVGGYGNASANSASNLVGVRPFALLI